MCIRDRDQPMASLPVAPQTGNQLRSAPVSFIVSLFRVIYASSNPYTRTARHNAGAANPEHKGL